MRLGGGGIENQSDDDERVTVSNCKFSDMESSKFYGAIYANEMKGISIQNSKFRDIARGHTPKDWSKAHAVYFAHRSGGTVSGCNLTNVSGDGIRARDDSHITMSDCHGKNVGKNGLASAWTGKNEKDSTIQDDPKHKSTNAGTYKG